jgi:hypothetical protein
MKGNLKRRIDSLESILALERVQNYQNLAQCVHQLMEAGEGGGVEVGE